MTTYRLNVSHSGTVGGGPSLAGTGGGSPPVARPQVQQIQSPNLNIMAGHLREISAGTAGFPGAMQAIGKQMGIKFGLAGILKQSQLFTGMIGSIFQIAGAAVDIILAAFMPIIVPAIRAIASILPVLHTVVENTLGRVVEWIVKFYEFVSGDAISDGVGGVVTKGLEFFLGPNSDLAKKIGDGTGATMGFAAKMAVWTLPLLLLTPMGKFLRVGGGIAKVFTPITRGLTALKNSRVVSGAIRGLTTWFKGTGFGSKIASAFGNSKVMQGIGRALGFGKGAKTATQVATKGGGLLGGLKGLAGKAGRIPGVGAITKLGGKALPIIGTAMLAWETATETVKNFNDARKSGKSLGTSLALAGTTAAMGIAATGTSLVAPMAGMAMMEAGKIGTNAMMNKWGGTDRNLLEGTIAGGVINLITNVNGETQETSQIRINEAASQSAFQQDIEAGIGEGGF